MKRLACILMMASFTIWSQDNIEMKGVSFSMANKKTSKSDIKPIKELNSNWIAIVPYGFLKDNEILYDSEYQWVGERPEAIRECVQLAHNEGLKVMIKPHIWIGHGSYTGIHKCETEKEWLKLETSYESYIMEFVEIAIEEDVEMFSVGTEWGQFVQTRPEFWKSLIDKIDKKYDGKITYSANWDDYQKVTFWDQLDYIGIDSYFPLSQNPNPKYTELVQSWKAIIPVLEQFSSAKKTKIIFTEYGYKSTSHATISPWEHKDEGKYSAKVQNLAFKAFFNTIWKKSWFAGGFVWKWYHNHGKVGGKGNTDFTPQNKPAEETIRAFYGK